MATDSNSKSTSVFAQPWAQLIIGIICMVMIANLQYGWTLFIDPIEQKYHWGRAAIQVAFTIFIVTETWLQPLGGYLIDRFGPRVMVCIGGALVAIGAAHHYDTQVRTHFIKTLGPSKTTSSKDLEDAIPAAAVFVATWGYANLIGDSNGRGEAWAMLEAVGLSSVTAFALKYAGGRERPDQTSDPNQWRKSGGNSFPSVHATAAFAVGTVLAESGNDDYRWVRRFLGYGLGAGTSYERLKHNAHWLSDTVAGAALGIASAHFAMNRRDRTDEQSSLRVVPVERGAMLTYNVSLP